MKERKLKLINDKHKRLKVADNEIIIETIIKFKREKEEKKKCLMRLIMLDYIKRYCYQQNQLELEKEQ